MYIIEIIREGHELSWRTYQSASTCVYNYAEIMKYFEKSGNAELRMRNEAGALFLNDKIQCKTTE